MGRRFRLRLSIHLCVATAIAAVLVSAFSWAMFSTGYAFPAAAAALVLAIVAEIAFGLTDNIIGFFLRPKKLELQDYVASGIPDQSRVVIAVPVLVHDTEQLSTLMETAIWNIQVANDSNVSLVFLADLPDTDQAEDSQDEIALLEDFRHAVNDANQRLGKNYANPIHYLYRERTYSHAQQCWMGYERKRGKIELINSLALERSIEGIEARDETLATIRRAAYVLCLDEDSKLTPNTLQYLVGVLDHPDNKPVLEDGVIKTGYGMAVAQSLIDQSSAVVWRMSRAIVGFRIDPRCAPPVGRSFAFDWFGEARFGGKALYDPRVFDEVCRGRLPENLILSHDTLEGAYLRPAFVGMAAIADSFPQSHRSLFTRSERWMRGDINNLFFAFRKAISSKAFDTKGALPLYGYYVLLQQAAAFAPMVALFPLLSLAAISGGTLAQYTVVLVLVGLGSLQRLALNTVRDIKRRMPWAVALRVYPPYLGRIAFSLLHKIMVAPANFFIAMVALVVSLYRLTMGRRLIAWKPALAADRLGHRWLHWTTLSSSAMALLVLGGVWACDQMSLPTLLLAGLWALLAVADLAFIRKEG